jgi:predicted XRE-type DNA-binding protein
MERWKPVVGFEGFYEVSNQGQVRTVRTGRIKKQTTSKTENRPFLGLWKENRLKIKKPSVLVLEAFVGPRPVGMECCHNDGNAFNNALGNLRWDTPTANQHDRVKHGTSNRGERCGTAKLTLAQVNAIRRDRRLQREIANEYGVQQSAISRIKNGKRWGYS